MKRIPATLLLLATLPTLSLTTRAADDSDLQGRWSIVAVPAGWKKVPGTSVVIESGEVKICVARVTTSKMSYKLDPSNGTVESRRVVKGKPVVQLGVYRRQGDTLTLSVAAEGKPRPATPDSTEGGAMKWVFKRSK